MSNFQNKRGFTIKRAERHMCVFTHVTEASVGREAVRGFTLVETLIAVSILAFATAGPLYTASRALVAAEIARDKLTASYLAQEGVEYVRLMRDNEYLAAYRDLRATVGADISGTAWNSFTASASATGSIASCRTTTCTLDPARPMGVGGNLSLQPCAGDTCTPLYVSNDIYTEQSGIAGAVKTPFTRTIQVISVTSNDMRVVSIVSWSFHGTPYLVSITSHLTPWQ